MKTKNCNHIWEWFDREEYSDDNTICIWDIFECILCGKIESRNVKEIKICEEG